MGIGDFHLTPWSLVVMKGGYFVEWAFLEELHLAIAAAGAPAVGRARANVHSFTLAVEHFAQAHRQIVAVPVRHRAQTLRKGHHCMDGLTALAGQQVLNERVHVGGIFNCIVMTAAFVHVGGTAEDGVDIKVAEAGQQQAVGAKPGHTILEVGWQGNILLEWVLRAAAKGTVRIGEANDLVFDAVFASFFLQQGFKPDEDGIGLGGVARATNHQETGFS